MTGLAPGADAWHALARRRHRSATRWARLVLAASKEDDREEWRARAEAAEAEVERLRAKLAAAREAWGKRSDLSWHSAFANGAVALRYEYAVLVTAALADEAEAGYRQARGALQATVDEKPEDTIRRMRGDDSDVTEPWLPGVEETPCETRCIRTPISMPDPEARLCSACRGELDARGVCVAHQCPMCIDDVSQPADDLEARLVRLAKVDGTVWLAVFDDDSARAWTRLTPMDSASHGTTPLAAVAALEAQLEADRE